MFKKHKGITLIALIITIIIMLILVGVSIQLVINSGLFETAKNAGIKTDEAYRNESNLGSEIVIDGKTYASMEDYVANKEKLPEGAGKKVAENTTFEYQSDGKTAIIPGGFTVSGVPSEASIDGGLVIYLIDDKTDEEITGIDWTDGTTVANLQTTYDQFVWIPIARENINDMYMCQSEDGTKSCKITVQEVEGEEVAYCTTHSSTNMAGRLYATSTGENFNSSLTTQTYTANSGLREPAVVTGNSTGTGTSYDNSTTDLGYLNGILGTNFYPTTDTTNNTGTATTDLKTYLQEEYNDIVKSVYENQGFYVGRYETSNITTSDGTAIKVVAGAIPSNSINWYYMYAQQKDYATNKVLTSVGSTMIQGAAYDQVMKFVENGTRPDGASYNVTTKGNVAHGSSQGITAVYQTGGLNYPSGATVSYNDVSKNIYDLEGNVCAWTTEAYTTYNRVFRGGPYSYSDSASYRSYSGTGVTDTLGRFSVPALRKIEYFT